MTAFVSAEPEFTSVPGRGVRSAVSVEAPQTAGATYGSTALSLVDSALLTGAVVLRLDGLSDGGELLAVPSGPGRLGGCLPVPVAFADEVVDVLAALPGFDGVRLEADGGGGLLVVWGAVCPARISALGRRRFYGGAGAGGLGVREAVVVDALAHGTPVAALVVCRLAAGEREVCERMDGVGAALTGWRGMTWTAIVHEAVRRGVVPAGLSQPVGLSPQGMGLLDAWAAGVPWERVADLLAVTAPGALRELEVVVCRQLGARSALHAVLRGHESGLLRARGVAAAGGSGRGP
ncbi:DUF6302 family protein [Streptomyces sp. NPDC088789]|uniref:DUF6302 family protein n=1 Tax=Streptomyces sp. NPDC088789 TaxID=3365899 RepID=UPI0038219A72